MTASDADWPGEYGGRGDEEPVTDHVLLTGVVDPDLAPVSSAATSKSPLDLREGKDSISRPFSVEEEESAGDGSGCTSIGISESPRKTGSITTSGMSHCPLAVVCMVLLETSFTSVSVDEWGEGVARPCPSSSFPRPLLTLG